MNGIWRCHLITFSEPKWFYTNQNVKYLFWLHNKRKMKLYFSGKMIGNIQTSVAAKLLDRDLALVSRRGLLFLRLKSPKHKHAK